VSLPTASKSTQDYLQAGCGLACAVASAEMALFANGLSLCLDHAGAISLRLYAVEVSSLQIDDAVASLCSSIMRRSRLCGSIMRRRCLCGWIMWRCRLCIHCQSENLERVEGAKVAQEE
jgi:hypothetical protein